MIPNYLRYYDSMSSFDNDIPNIIQTDIFVSFVENRDLVSYGESPINFEDKEVKRICVKNFGGENGIKDKYYGVVGIKGYEDEITYKQILAVKRFGGIMNRNKNIRSFNELRYFRNCRKLTNDYFLLRECYKLSKITFPDNVEEIGGNMYFQALYSNIKYLYIPKSVKHFYLFIEKFITVDIEPGNDSFEFVGNVIVDKNSGTVGQSCTNHYVEGMDLVFPPYANRIGQFVIDYGKYRTIEFKTTKFERLDMECVFLNATIENLILHTPAPFNGVTAYWCHFLVKPKNIYVPDEYLNNYLNPSTIERLTTNNINAWTEVIPKIKPLSSYSG